MENGERESWKAERLPYLISINSQGTSSQPAKGAYELVEAVDQRLGTVSSSCMGFPASDFEECGPVIWSHGARAAEAVAILSANIGEPTQWALTAQSASDAVNAAVVRASETRHSVMIADTQDNPGIGGTGSTTGVLHALLAAEAGKVFPGRIALGVLYDPGAAALAHRTGVGATFEGAVGESIQTPAGPSERPVSGTFRVCALSDGVATFKGPKMTGFRTQLGASACLELHGILIVVASGRIGAQDRELFRMVGIDPEDMKIIVVKSSHHFRADFDRLVEVPEKDIFFALARGQLLVDPAELPWKKLPPSTRLRP